MSSLPRDAGQRRLLVTRPAAQAETALRELRGLGIDAYALPLIGIAPLADRTPLAALWADIEAWQVLVFVSQNAVTHFFATRPAGVAWPHGALAAAPGPGTAAALREAGVPAAQVVAPAADGRQDSEALWAALAPRRGWRAAPVLILRGADASAAPVDAGVGREWLAAALLAAGAEVRLQAVYRRGPAELSASERRLLDAALDAPSHHVWLLASAEAVDHLQALVVQGGRPWPAQPGAAIATHPRIAERARAAGFAPVLVSAGDAAAVAACLTSASIEFPPS
jgi:uroporphyrinogen-III synthase